LADLGIFEFFLRIFKRRTGANSVERTGAFGGAKNRTGAFGEAKNPRMVNDIDLTGGSLLVKSRKHFLLMEDIRNFEG